MRIGLDVLLNPNAFFSFKHHNEITYLLVHGFSALIKNIIVSINRFSVIFLDLPGTYQPYLLQFYILNPRWNSDTGSQAGAMTGKLTPVG